MNINSWKRHSLAVAAGAVLLVAGTVRGEDKPQPGIVRITDRAPTNSQVAPVGHSHEGEIPAAPVFHGPLLHGDGQCSHGHCEHGGGNIVHVGPEYEYTGHFLHDICTTLRMKTDAWCTKRKLQRQAECGGDCDDDRCDSHRCRLKCRLFGCRHDGCDDPGCSKCGNHSACDSCGGRGCDDCNGTGKCLDGRLGECLANHRKRYGYFYPTGGGGHGLPWAGCYHMGYALNPEHYDYRDGGVYAAPGYGVPMAVPLAPNVNHTFNYGWGIPSSRLTPVSRRVREPGIIPAMQPVVMPPPPYPPQRPAAPAAAAPRAVPGYGYPGYPGYPAGPAYPGANPAAQPMPPAAKTEAGA